MKNKIVYLLIGPKGSGKSFIGTLMDERLGIRFIRVENISKKVKKDRQIDDQS
jgi:shikimate kinase